MPAASTLSSNWLANRLPSLLVFATLLASQPVRVNAQEGALRLRLAEELTLGPREVDSRSIESPSSRGTAPLRLLLAEPASARPERNAVAQSSPPAPVTLPPATAGLVRAAHSAMRVIEALLQADVNQQKLNDSVVVLKRDDGLFFIAGEDLDRWKLRRPDSPPYEHEGKLFYPVTDLPRMKIEVDERRQTMTVSADPQAFVGSVGVMNSQNYPPPVLPQPGGFLNYTLSASRTQGTTTHNGLFEAGYFSERGVLTTSMLSPDLTKTGTWLRLETTYAIDDPKDMTSIRLGDAVTNPGAWGRAVRFGGMQFGTNFATQPTFIRTPVLQTAGSASLPSTVDVFVNNALVQRSSVSPGPFSIQNIPVVTGSGEVRVVVRDLLGREQVISQPFYSGAVLLKPGLTDFSYSVGEIRNNFALASNDYGSLLGTATYRRGINDYLTGELRAEATKGLGVLGGSTALRIGNFGIVNGTLAGSRSQAGFGQLLGLGLERLTSSVSVSFQSQVTSPQFRQAGMANDELPRRRQTSATVAYAMGPLGSLSGTYAIQQFRDQPQAQVATLTYAVPVGNNSNVALSFMHTSGTGGGNTIFTTLTIPFGERTSGSATFDRERNSSTGAVTTNSTLVAQRSLPLGDGYGYRVQVRNQDVLGSYSVQTGVGTYTVEASQPKDGAAAARVGVTGGVGFVGGHPFLSRTLTDSFGVVRVADYPNVRVLQDNQGVARTDQNGYAVLPRLRAYDRNQISLDQNDLPLDATFDRLRLDAIPYYRSGVLLDFPVRRVRAATMQVLLEDGSPLPSGALARFEGRDKEFPVALGGEVYLEGFEESNRIVFTWRSQTCSLSVPYPRTNDALPHLGTFTCKGVKQ